MHNKNGHSSFHYCSCIYNIYMTVCALAFSLQQSNNMLLYSFIFIAHANQANNHLKCRDCIWAPTNGSGICSNQASRILELRFQNLVPTVLNLTIASLRNRTADLVGRQIVLV